MVRVVPVDELADLVGSGTGRSEWFPIDQGRIDAFAEATEDRQWIHVDPEAARQGPFGATIAHGFLTLSLVSALSAEASVIPRGAAMLINYGSDKVRFLNPVLVGSRIRTVSTLKDVRERAPGQILLTSGVVVEIEGEETPAMVADVLTLAVMAPD
jgi:acyl dehydratase